MQPHPARYWHKTEEGRMQCDLCPRACVVSAGQRAFCYVRVGTENGMALDTYGRSSGFCIDPIEKKPLHHFYPGTSVLSFGTAGCNLGCKFCQNWDISKARVQDKLNSDASPEAIARAALEAGCRSVAFTYNDPVIFAEYAIDTAKACHDIGVRSVAVTAGYISPGAREEFFAQMDAANIDLKAFTEEFYWKQTGGHLQPVLDTIRYVARETPTWLEITTLLIPGLNDSDDELDRMCAWLAENAGLDVPLHFSAFHPDYKLTEIANTPASTLRRAREIARRHGLRYVYVGNVHDRAASSTYCPRCDNLVIERDWYELGRYDLRDGACRACGEKIAGRFEAKPGAWGARRLPVRISP